MLSMVYYAKRSWGGEFIIRVTPYFVIKLLYLTEGNRGGLQYHHFKDETGLLISGRLSILEGESLDSLRESTIIPGTIFSFKPGVIHREEAIEDSIILEISTPHFNDRVRLDSDTKNDLQSTTPDQVVDLGKVESVPSTLRSIGFKQIPTSQLPEQILSNLSFAIFF